MGNFSSKIFPEMENESKTNVQTEMKMSAIEKNQMCTPVMSRKVSIDPRSATVGITRTPIEVASTPVAGTKKVASAIPKYLRTKPYLETNLDLIMPAITPEKRIPDPRSPNVTQERTPIMVKAKAGYISPIVTVQEGPDMATPDTMDPRSPATTFDRTPVCRSNPSNLTEDSTEIITRMSYCETTGTFNLPEIQAISKIPTIVITASKNLEERLKACTLATPEENVDESLDDDVFHSEESESEDQITVIPNLRAIAEVGETDVNEEPRENSKISVGTSQMPLKLQNSEEKGLIRVWRDSVSPLPPAEPLDIPREDSTRPEEIMIEFDDETNVKASQPDVQKANVKVEDKSRIQIVNKQIKKVQGKVEVKGVFEDVSSDSAKSRTPLGCRSNHKSGISSKSPQQVLRSKGLSTKPGQQENTPPNTKRFRSKIKGNGTQWDPDMSVII
uniref:Cdca3_0 protein n=1 Tax=Fopius arisanus TaxID=64838 RepID=A0A0C9RJP1_9HYME